MLKRPTHQTPGQEALWNWLDRTSLSQREAARVLEIHYMSLNQMLQGRRRPALATALLIERNAGIPASIWVRTRVSAVKRRKSETAGTPNKQSDYRHVD